MAKYNIEFSCGHTEARQIIGKSRDRESKAEWMAQGLCSDCWEAEKKRQFDEQNVKAAEEAKEYGLPDLTGSEKQVAWANTLRQNWIVEADGYIARFEKLQARDGKEEEAKRLIAGMKAAMESRLLAEDSARFWIDTRESSASRYLKEAGEKVLEEPEVAPIEVPKDIQEEALAEMVIRPTKPVTDLIAEIRLKDGNLTARLPERDEDFVQVDLRLSWRNGRWERNVSFETVGPPLDRGAELGIKLLAAGFPIRVYDEQLQKQIQSGTYAPECDRWILTHNKGFRIWWSRDEGDFYPEAKRLPGASWISEKRSMYVPPEAFRDLQGFAEQYEFRFTQKAQEKLQEAAQAFEAAMVLDVAVPKEDPLPQPGSVPKKLKVEEFDVDESLKDEE